MVDTALQWALDGYSSETLNANIASNVLGSVPDRALQLLGPNLRASSSARLSQRVIVWRSTGLYVILDPNAMVPAIGIASIAGSDPQIGGPVPSLSWVGRRLLQSGKSAGNSQIHAGAHAGLLHSPTGSWDACIAPPSMWVSAAAQSARLRANSPPSSAVLQAAEQAHKAAIAATKCLTDVWVWWKRYENGILMESKVKGCMTGAVLRMACPSAKSLPGVTFPSVSVQREAKQYVPSVGSRIPLVPPSVTSHELTSATASTDLSDMSGNSRTACFPCAPAAKDPIRAHRIVTCSRLSAQNGTGTCEGTASAEAGTKSSGESMDSALLHFDPNLLGTECAGANAVSLGTGISL